jgi:nicotinamidase-related amidase
MDAETRELPALANPLIAGPAEAWYGRNLEFDTEPLARPTETALIIVDMQNDFAHPDGVMGSVLKADMTDAEAILPRIKNLIDGARKAGVLIVYLQNVNLPHGRSSSDPEVARRVARATPPDITLQGSWGADFMKEIEPLPGDPLITKHRRSGFLHTDLDMVLRASGRDVTLCVGMATAACVTGTALDAAQRDYYCYVISDCVGGYARPLHDAALAVLRTQVAGVVTSDEVLAAWA